MKKTLCVIFFSFFLFSSTFGQSKPEPTKHEILGLFDAVFDKVDFSLKQYGENKKYKFSLAYRLFAFNGDSDAGTPQLRGPVLTTQAIFGDRVLFTPKLGYRIAVGAVNVQLDAGLNTDFNQVSYSFSPSIGLSLLESLGIYYEFDVQGGKHHFENIGRYRIGLFISPMVISAFGKAFGGRK